MERNRWSNRLVGATDLEGEVLPGQAVVELLGDCRVLVEHHCGVTEYGREQIRVRMKYGFLCIQGHGLELVRMCADQLVITGRIDGVQVIRRG